MAFNGVIPAGDLNTLPYGLFSVAEVTERGDRDEHWGQGFDAMSEACAFDAKLVDICGAVEPVDVYTMDGRRFNRVRPFGILAYDTCLSIGFSVDDREARVRRQLELVTQKAVETEFWNGLYRSAWDAEMGADAVPLGYLAHEDTETLNGGTAVIPRVGLALLEQALSDCGPGFQGVIHLSPLVASMLAMELRPDATGKKLLTPSGNLVAIGSGYNGSGPGQSVPPSATSHWMYATSPVHVVLGSKELVTVGLAQATNVTTNEMTYVAERPAAVYTDGCCQFAARADIAL